MRLAGLIAVATLGALALAGLLTWFLVFRDTSDPVTVEEAVTSFRTETETEPAAPRVSPIPEGVYVYTTAGYEKTDALTGVMHRYPRRSTITVAAAECGVRLTWRVLKGRSTEWLYCTGADGWELRSQDERHTFFGRTERTTYVCVDTPIRPAGAMLASWAVTCSTDDTEETGTVTRLRREPLEHVRKRARFAGAIRGTAQHDLWFDPSTGVPVKLVLVSRTTNESPIGDVHYEEEVRLLVTSLTPRR